MVKRFDVVLTDLEPVKGSEMSKMRPCVVVSPDAMNESKLNTIIIAPMTSQIRPHFPTRIMIDFAGKQGQVALDQLRVVDRLRVVKNLGTLSALESKNILECLQELFS